MTPARPTRPELVGRLRSAGCVFAEDEADLLLDATGDPAALAVLVERRVAGEPLEHVLGWAEFGGLRIALAAGVFVPRRRSELMVRRAVELAGPAPTVVDLCCGSGAVAAAVVSAVRPARLVAVDIEPAAVRCATGNLAPLGGRVLLGDLYQPLPSDLRGRVDLLLANVPYVPSAAVALMPPEARLHEPRIALDGGADGLDVLRRVAAGAPGWLADGGHLLVEVGEGQVPAARAALRGYGLRDEVVYDPDTGATVVTGRAGDPARTGRHDGTTELTA